MKLKRIIIGLKPCMKKFLLEANKTWKIVLKPQGKNIIGSKWVYKAKYDFKGNLEKYKARLVAKDFSQKEGAD